MGGKGSSFILAYLRSELLLEKRSPWPSTMLRQDEVAFVNAISALEFSPALLRELWKAMATRQKKK